MYGPPLPLPELHEPQVHGSLAGATHRAHGHTPTTLPNAPAHAGTAAPARYDREPVPNGNAHLPCPPPYLQGPSPTQQVHQVTLHALTPCARMDMPAHS